MPHLHRTVLVFACLAASVPAQAPVPDAILALPFAPTAAEITADVGFFASDAMAGRESGSEQAKAAAARIAAVYKELGLEPAGDGGGFEQTFDRMAMVAVPQAASFGGAQKSVKVEARKLQCRNVLAWLPGADPALRDEFILIGAHFDHLGTRGDDVFNGADDNASGTAGLLAIARACAKGKHKPRRSILFVAFGAEEQGLRGSRHLARNPPRSLQKLVAMINLDMIGRPRLLDQRALNWAKGLAGIPNAPAVGVLGTDQSPELAAIARAVFEAEKLPMFAPEDFGVLGQSIKKMADGRSDHAPFQQRGIPYLFFSTSEHDDYHKPTDTVDKVDGDVIRRIAAGVYRTVLAVDARDARPTFVKEPKPVGAKPGEKGK